MPAPKKAAKKVPAKKAPAKKAPDHVIKDERRAQEHLARVEGLHRHIEKQAGKETNKLTDLAHQELEAGHMNHAADLLRAAEHLSFALLHGPKGREVHPKLAEEFEHEFEKKMEEAEDHWSEKAHLEGLDEVYLGVRERAEKALDGGHYQAALEFARAVEALSHVQEEGEPEEEEVGSEEEETDSEDEE